MVEEILKEFLGTTKTIDDLFNEVFEIKDKYKNGEHISHCEKEIKDGKVIKDVNNRINLEDKKNCKCDDNVCQCNKTDKVKDENNHSYFYSVKDEYEDGNHVYHSEKEVKDGQVIKNVDHFINLENNKNCNCNDKVCDCNKKLDDYEKKEKTEKPLHAVIEKLKSLNKHLTQSFRSAENALIEKDKKIAELERKLAEVTKDKEYLLNKFEQVKNVFSK